MGGGRDKNKNHCDFHWGSEGVTQVVKAQRERSLAESLHNVRYVKAEERGGFWLDACNPIIFVIIEFAGIMPKSHV